MNGQKIRFVLGVFFFGLAVGGFFSVTVIREAVPLRDHVWMIALSLAFGIPIILGLVFWYIHVVKVTQKALGPKGGELISQLIGFQLASTVLIFIILLSIFYAAIA